MKTQTRKGDRCSPPFPVYADPVDALLSANGSERNATVAHILALSAGFAYADIDTMSMMMSRAGFAGHDIVSISELVDAMYIDTTAYLMRSACGRVAILTYRGTSPGSLTDWRGDADIGSDSIHAGFARNLSATRLGVIDALNERPFDALYVTGHSLGGALAVLFALSIATNRLSDRLRSVYTFGQPMVCRPPLTDDARAMTARIFRHVMPRDVVPALPPADYGAFEHFGREYRFEGGAWQLQEKAIAQLVKFRQAPRMLLRRDATRYTIAEHAPHVYIAALRPAGRVTEFGDG
ncbi:MAG TPA: lipase family protein [Thermoanaerobaculia bacterium]|nr:lipase family protein [Thermoanaerobaculia bacterium]